MTSIKFESDRIIIESDDESKTCCTWNNVKEIRTYKRDLLTFDEVVLALLIDNTWFEISESSQEFNLIRELVDRYIPEVPSDWYQTVLYPPFEENFRVIWKSNEH